ncbi:MAG: hypothetical protein PVG63_03480, partial [Anaerolineales bacterium]
IALDTPQELKLQYGERKATVLLEDRSQHVLGLDNPEDAIRMEEWMREGKVLTVHSHEASLEDVFIHLAGRSLQ